MYRFSPGRCSPGLLVEAPITLPPLSLDLGGDSSGVDPSPSSAVYLQRQEKVYVYMCVYVCIRVRLRAEPVVNNKKSTIPWPKSVNPDSASSWSAAVAKSVPTLLSVLLINGTRLS